MFVPASVADSALGKKMTIRYNWLKKPFQKASRFFTFA
jgi:hypothetical protein